MELEVKKKGGEWSVGEWGAIAIKPIAIFQEKVVKKRIEFFL
jgi:hypothetical protein